MATTQTPQPIIVQSGNNGSVGQYVFGAILIGAGLWFGNKWYKDHKAQKEAGKLDSPAAQAASRIRTAIEGAGTNETELYNTARFIAENKIVWKDVAQSYKNLYQANIEDDLRSDFDAEDLKTFYNIFNNTTVSTIAPPPAAAVQFNTTTGTYLVKAIKPSNVRKSPSTKTSLVDSAASILVPTMSSSNIIRQVPMGSVIGIITGKSKSDNTGTLFYEVHISVIESASPVKVRADKAWIAASQIELKKYPTSKAAVEALAAGSFGKRILFTKVEFDKAKYVE